MSDFGERNIFEVRQEFLADLRQKVDAAFENRKVVKIIPEGG